MRDETELLIQCLKLGFYVSNSGWITWAHSGHLHLAWQAQLTAWLLMSWGLCFTPKLLEINLTYWLVSFYGYSHQPLPDTWNILDLVPPLMRATSYGTLYQSRLIRSAWAVPRYQPYCEVPEHTDPGASKRCRTRHSPNSQILLQGQLEAMNSTTLRCNLGSLVVQHTCIEELLGK